MRLEWYNDIADARPPHSGNVGQERIYKVEAKSGDRHVEGEGHAAREAFAMLV